MAKRLNPGVAVAGITIAALVGVGFLAAQAANSAPENRGIAKTSTPTPTASTTATTPPKVVAPPPIPANSGEGKRVVYSLSQNRVWLVDDAERSLREYTVAPAPYRPVPDTYRVTIKVEDSRPGSDGLQITHSVRFGFVEGIPLGFAATTTPLEKIKPGDPTTVKSAGIRERPGDGLALWNFAPVGTPVIVVE